jgi:putative transcriptional regulator
MNENGGNTIKLKWNDDGSVVRIMPDGTEQPFQAPEPDYARIDAMTDAELTANALSDPDNPPVSPEEFRAMPTVPNVAAIRKSIGLSQENFARAYHIPVGTLRDWEQGRRLPDRSAVAYLHVIERMPLAVLEVLQETERSRS